MTQSTKNNIITCILNEWGAYNMVVCNAFVKLINIPCLHMIQNDILCILLVLPARPNIYKLEYSLHKKLRLKTKRK